jgi:hypothetical protein
MPERGKLDMKKLPVLMLLFLSWSIPTWSGEPVAESKDTSFVGTHSSLKNFIFNEPESEFTLGVGLIPVGVMGGKFLIGVDVFQLNWANSWLDWEILSTTIGFGFAQDSTNNSRHFIAATLPKYRISESLSFGLMLGYESATFNNLLSFIEKNKFYTPNEPFSGSSLIYGLSASEYLTFANMKRLKISEKVFRENYSIEQTAAGWNLNFPQFGKNFDKTPIKPSWVFLLEISLLI